MKKLDFRVRVEVDADNGAPLSVYLQVRNGKVSKVRELVAGDVFVNYDHKGTLLGVEILAPCRIAIFDQIARKEPKEVKEFLVGKIPRELALSA